MSFASSMAGRSYANSAGASASHYTGGVNSVSSAGSSGISAGGALMAGSAILGASQAYFGAKAAQSQYNIKRIQVESQYNIKRIQAKKQKRIAQFNGKITTMNMTQAFNKSRASDVVMAAAQNRRGGSVAAIASASEAQYNWDLDLAAMGTKLEEMGYQANAANYKAAGEYASTEYAAAADYAGGTGMLTNVSTSMINSAMGMAKVGSMGSIGE